MAGNVKLMTSAGGGVILDTATTTATDITVKVPAVNGNVVLTDVAGTVALNATGANIITASTNGSERMRIDSSGNLLFGTGGQPFMVYRSNSGGEPAAGNSFGMRLSNGTSGPQIKTYANANTWEHQGFYNTTSGSVVQVGGISTATSTTTYATSSDYRLKENIQPMQNALATVAQLNPVTYTWKADGSDGQGFIAHELQAVVPDCVTGEKDAVDEQGNPVYQGIDTSFLVATLTKAIQEQQEQINELKAEVAALKGAA